MLVAPSLLHDGARVTSDPGELVEKLTVRGHEVLPLMGKGMSPRAKAKLVNISVNTCRGYLKTIHAKLGARRQLEAVMKAQRPGLVESPDRAKARV
jgi:DNA-binding CsgD family transcriptional regulator